MDIIDQLGLREDPFKPADGTTGFGMAPPMRATFDKLLAAVRRADPLTVLVGRPGMGKTLLLGMLEQACRADGLEVCTVARGDMAHTALGSGAQLLLVDEADTINTATLTALAPGGVNAAAPIMVFAVVQPALHRLSADVRTTVIELRPLDPDGARQFLAARAAAAGRPDLFTAQALDIIVDAARGSPRLLRVLAGAAMYQAAGDTASQIMPDHASLAATMHGRFLGPMPSEPPVPVAANDVGPFPDEGVGNPVPMVTQAARHRRARQRIGVLSFAASVALAALVLPVFLVPDPVEDPLSVQPANAASVAAGPVRLASAFAVAPANAAASSGPVMASLPAVPGPPRPMAVPPVIAAPAWPAVARPTTGAGIIVPRVAVVDVATELPRLGATIRPADLTMGDRAALLDLLAATRLRLAVANRRGARGQPGADGDKGAARLTTPIVDEAVPTLPASAVDVTALTQPTAAARPTVAVAQPAVLAALSSASVRQTAQTARSAKDASGEAAAAKQAADAAKSAKTAAENSKLAAEEARAAKAAAQQSKESAGEARSGKDAAQQAKLVAEQAKAAKQVAEQAKSAKESAGQAKAVKEAAKQAAEAKEAVAQTQSAKQAADHAKAAKDAAVQAQSAKEAAQQAKAAKDAADQAKSAKEAAEQAKSAKEAAEQAKAAKQASEQAKAAKDAAEQAKAAKHAADQAKAAKEAAEQAKAAKDAADQAKAAKDAADQAKAAKDAADQAKAAKEAADQARAAKEAAEQAKAAKDAADQAKAAKDAADQAKAAKEAADQAKAAKEAAEQAKAARDAADQAKAVKDAVKAAKDNVKAVKDATKGN